MTSAIEGGTRSTLLSNIMSAHAICLQNGSISSGQAMEAELADRKLSPIPSVESSSICFQATVNPSAASRDIS